MKKCLFLLLLLCYIWTCSCQKDCYLYASNLKTENRISPLSVDVPNPRLSWYLLPSNASCRDQYQSSYRVLVASSPLILAKNVGDYWDSDQIVANDTINIIYRGNSIPSRTRVYWKVIIWDNNNNMWNGNTYAWWETPLLFPSDWSAKWIQRYYLNPPLNVCDWYKEDPVPLFRKEFSLGGKDIYVARLYISGLGYYEAFINGQKVGDNVLDPGLTTYNRTTLYETYDVINLINSTQTNTIGIVLGNGWFNPLPMLMFGYVNLRNFMSCSFPPTVVAQLNIDFVDGTSFVLGTNNNWKVGAGAIMFNNIYLGEIYDFNKEQTGWTASGFNDSSWPAAVDNYLNGIETRMIAQYAPPIKMFDLLPSVSQDTVFYNTLVVDLGRNFAGWIEINISNAQPSQQIYLKYGEILFPNGTVNGLTSVAGQIKWDNGGPCAPSIAFQTDTLIMRGLKYPAVETYRQTFTWHGFRYVEITTEDSLSLPDKISVYGITLHSDLPVIGQFESSNHLFNAIQRMVVNSILSNSFSIQSDCPARERFGYTGDAHASDIAIMYNFDMSNFYRKRVYDMVDASMYLQTEHNFHQDTMTETAPFVGLYDNIIVNYSTAIGWGSLFPQLQWELYKFTGDTTLLSELYDMTKGWVDLLISYSDSHNGSMAAGAGDWMAVNAANDNFTSNLFYFENVKQMAQIAGVLGQYSDQLTYLEKSELIKAKINLDYLKNGGIYDNGSQSAQSFALWHGIVPDDLLTYVLQALVDSVSAAQNHLTVGMFGILYLLEMLSELGRADLAFSMVNQTTYPGFGFMVANGSTTLWESWSYSDNIMSHNHAMFGSVTAWFFEYP